MTTVQEVINECYIENGVVKLPGAQLERKLYEQVAAKLQGIGGKWKGGKVFGFEFGQIDPAPLLARIQDGEKINLKKDFQFFETPENVALHMVCLLDYQPGQTVLEPSAGQGALLDAFGKTNPNVTVDCCELMETNYDILDRRYFTTMVGRDFLQLDAPNTYDRIIANPPFAKNQDIDHVYKMFECLKPGGRIVVVTSAHWTFSRNAKEAGFRDFLDNLDAERITLEKGTFSNSGTEVAAFILVINKPA